jgi:hypothetical protein
MSMTAHTRLRIAGLILGVFAAPVAATASPLVTFEAPTYTADQPVDGVDNWNFTFQTATNKVTSASTTPNVVLSGDQSLAVQAQGLKGRSFNLTGPLPTVITTSYLTRVDADASYGDAFLTNSFSGVATPMGVYAYQGSTFQLYGNLVSNNGVPVVANNTYLVEIVVDFSTAKPTFEAFATNLTTAGTRLSLGTGTSYSALTAADIFENTNGGIWVGEGGAGIAYYDDISAPIPEPASAAILVAGVAMIARKSNPRSL